jgi:hypothetical protein
MTEAFPSFCFDRAVALFASTVTDEMDTAESALPEKASASMRQMTRTNILHVFLGIEPQDPAPGKYREPGR